MTLQTITPQELAERIRRGEVQLIDVRTPGEYQEAHIECARNVPLGGLDPAAVLRACNTGAPLYVTCQAGSRGTTACDKLRATGCGNVVNVAGGTRAWIDAGLPVVRGRKAISLERQVRIAAGLFVLLGIVLGYFWNVNFLWLSAFVGAGLMFAGITDTCGMAIVLAKMPWNRAAAASCSVKH